MVLKEVRGRLGIPMQVPTLQSRRPIVGAEIHSLINLSLKEDWQNGCDGNCFDPVNIH